MHSAQSTPTPAAIPLKTGTSIPGFQRRSERLDTDSSTTSADSARGIERANLESELSQTVERE